MTSLKALADAGECTVVCTIHQPQTKIFNILDNLILMKKATIVYQGAANCAEKYFAAYGYPCPDRCNPADHLLDIVTMGTHGEKDTQEQANLKMLTPPLNMDFGLEKDDFTLRAINPWLFQFFVLSVRCLHEKVRRWDIFLTNIFITCLVATFVGMGSWYQIGTAQDTVRMRSAICFFSVIHQGVVASLQGTYSFPLERALMLRERAAGTYYVSAYFFSKSTVEAVLQVWNPILYTAFTVPMTGFQATPEKFCLQMAFNILLSLCATSLANMMCCITVSIEMSTVCLALGMELTRLYSAFFVAPYQLGEKREENHLFPLSLFLSSSPGALPRIALPISSQSSFPAPKLSRRAVRGQVEVHRCRQLHEVRLHRAQPRRAGGQPLQPLQNQHVQVDVADPYRCHRHCWHRLGDWRIIHCFHGKPPYPTTLSTPHTPPQIQPHYPPIPPSPPYTLYPQGFDQYDIQYCAGMMVVYILIARFFSYLALRFIKT